MPKPILRLLLIIVLCLPTGALAKNVSVEALQMLNQIRADNGRPPLAISPKLARAADAHARDMAAKNRFSHQGSDGSTLGKRAKRQGYRFCHVAENIAMGQRDLRAAMVAWMNSPGHRKNILSREPTQFGLAKSAGNRWVMVLGRDGC